MDSEDQEDEGYDANKILIYGLSIILTVLLLIFSQGGFKSLPFYWKGIFFIVMVGGGIVGGYVSFWIDERFPYPMDKLAEKINMQDSELFKVIGAQCVGVIAGVILCGGMMAKFLDITI